MKKYFLTAAVGLPVILLSLLLLNFTLSNNKNHVQAEKKYNETVKHADGKESTHSCCSAGEDAGEFSDNSIYQLESGWISHSGEKITLGEFRGSNVVLTMFFASCTYACPILVNDMIKIENEIPEEELASYKFVLVSIDPERDTPHKLKKFAEEKNLDPERWILLTGSKDKITELAALTGFKYKKDKNGDFSHSNLITFLNKEGEIRHQQFGLNQEPSESVKILLSSNNTRSNYAQHE